MRTPSKRTPTREASKPTTSEQVSAGGALGQLPFFALSRSVFATWCLAASPASADDLKKSGTFTVEQVQIAFIGSGNLGGGTLKFGGKELRISPSAGSVSAASASPRSQGPARSTI